ncbi:DUF1304 family protein [Lactobacillaceae bacterium L1_55_11]|nr:DUF1304 family protein [Lactobacillaceae bacterium L1_55_11]
MVASILVIVVAVEALTIMGIEIFGSVSMQARAFDLNAKVLALKEVRVLLANQGVYNGLLGLLILLSGLGLSGSSLHWIWLLEMAFVFFAAVYGSLTATRKIILVQGLPALLAILALWLRI